jgi:DNA-binding NarL/FixJ family response regulator
LGSKDYVRHRILIVDDSVQIRRSLRWLIEQDLEWEVCGEAANGAEGVSRAAELKPDVIVLDLSMPVMNGIEAARRLKKMMPETHLLMLTSFALPGVEEAARSVGIEAFVAKSDGTASLVQSLQRIASPAGISSAD